MANIINLPDDVYAARIEFLRGGDASRLTSSSTYAARPYLFVNVDVGQLLRRMEASEIYSVKRMAQTLEAILKKNPLPDPETPVPSGARNDYLNFSSIHYTDPKKRIAVNNYLANLATLVFRSNA